MIEGGDNENKGNMKVGRKRERERMKSGVIGEEEDETGGERERERGDENRGGGG